MNLKPVAVVLASVTAVFCLVVGSYDKADSSLSNFYSQMLRADFSGARKSIDHAIYLWPANARYYCWRGYLTSQNLPPTCPRSTHGIGTPLERGDQSTVEAAIEDYRHALALNSRDAVAHHNLAWLEHLSGHDLSAAEEWSAAVSLDPREAIFELSYGMFLEEMGENQKARMHYETAIGLSPAMLDSPFFSAYERRSGPECELLVTNLIRKLEKELLVRRNPILEARLGKLYLFRKDLPRATQLLEDVAHRLPNLPLVWLNLGETYEGQARLGEARECYEKARVINDSLAEPYLRIAEIELRYGEQSAAAQDLRQAIQRWQAVTPLTAAHNNRLYNGPRQPIDELLPTTLIWYTSPCQASSAYRGLAKLFPERLELERRESTCEQVPPPHSRTDWSVLVISR
jgi:tetratricopeptide (TPR) repeat protein